MTSKSHHAKEQHHHSSILNYKEWFSALFRLYCFSDDCGLSGGIPVPFSVSAQHDYAPDYQKNNQTIKALASALAGQTGGAIWVVLEFLLLLFQDKRRSTCQHPLPKN